MIVLPPIPTFFQTADDVRKIVTTSDATAQGILIGVCLVFMAAIVVMWRDNRKMQIRYENALEKLHGQLLEQQNVYHKYIDIMQKVVENMR